MEHSSITGQWKILIVSFRNQAGFALGLRSTPMVLKCFTVFIECDEAYEYMLYCMTSPTKPKQK